MKTVMILVAFGAALVVACRLTTVCRDAKNEVNQPVTFCSSLAFPFSDAATWVAKVRHDNCASAHPEDQSNTDVLPVYA